MKRFEFQKKAHCLYFFSGELHFLIVKYNAQDVCRCRERTPKHSADWRRAHRSFDLHQSGSIVKDVAVYVVFQ